MITETKVETWIKTALEGQPGLDRVRFFIASEHDEPISRPAIFIDCPRITPTPGFLWSDGLFVAEVSVTIETAVGDRLPLFLALAESVRNRLKDTQLVCRVAPSIPGLNADNYSITSTAKMSNDQVRFCELTITAHISDHG